MIKLKVNNEIQDISSILVHFQDTPYPGKETYELKISLDEISIIKELEKLVHLEVNDKEFCLKLQKRHDSFYNPISYVQMELEKESSNDIRVAWVINNIKDVYIDHLASELIISGIASVYLNDFNKT